MIQINLVPDVKQEFIRAQRVRMTVVTIATFIGAGSIGLVVLLFMWLGAQGLRGNILDGSITDKSEKLAAVADIEETLTVQNQLSKIPDIYSSQHINSRIFDVIASVAPESDDDNPIQYSNVVVDTSTSTVSVEAQTPRFNGLDAFKKTIEATEFEFTTGDNEERTTVPLASNISIASQSYGQDSSGGHVLTFSLSFTYPEELLSPSSENARIITPDKTNATDSFRGIPKSLFTQKAQTEETEE